MADTTTMPRLKTCYREEIIPALQSEFDIKNVMQVPGLTKIVVNMGVGEAARDAKLIDGAVKDPTTYEADDSSDQQPDTQIGECAAGTRRTGDASRAAPGGAASPAANPPL